MTRELLHEMMPSAKGKFQGVSSKEYAAASPEQKRILDAYNGRSPGRTRLSSVEVMKLNMSTMPEDFYNVPGA